MFIHKNGPSSEEVGFESVFESGLESHTIKPSVVVHIDHKQRNKSMFIFGST